jgi:hypothetical protein
MKYAALSACAFTRWTANRELTSDENARTSQSRFTVHRHLLTPLNLLHRPIDKVAHNLVSGTGAVVKVHFDVLDAEICEMALVVSLRQLPVRIRVLVLGYEAHNSSFSLTTSPTFSFSNTLNTFLNA